MVYRVPVLLMKLLPSLLGYDNTYAATKDPVVLMKLLPTYPSPRQTPPITNCIKIQI